MYSSLPILMAQTDSRLESFSGGFRGNRAQFDFGDVVLFLAGFAVVVTTLWLLAKWSERRVRSDSSLELFWTIAKAHRISWGDRWLLWRIARARRVAEPALVFLDPRLTSPHFMGHLAPQVAARLKALRRRFFFGIDQVAEAPALPSDTDAGQVPAAPAPTIADPSIPSGKKPRGGPSGNLAEALGKIHSLNLQDQPVQKQESAAEALPDLTEESPPATAEFPDGGAPVLDLYPWLGNDWEITSTEE